MWVDSVELSILRNSIQRLYPSTSWRLAFLLQHDPGGAIQNLLLKTALTIWLLSHVKTLLQPECSSANRLAPSGVHNSPGKTTSPPKVFSVLSSVQEHAIRLGRGGHRPTRLVPYDKTRYDQPPGPHVWADTSVRATRSLHPMSIGHGHIPPGVSSTAAVQWTWCCSMHL
jgi:hypothetical protein